MNLSDLASIRPLLRRHGFHFSKRMGQNFLIASWVPERIAGESGTSADAAVLEIGPGIGVLTAELSARAARVVAVELDQTLLPVLRETMAERPNVRVIHGDILKQDIRALIDAELPGLRRIACANLPYHITTPAITALIEADCFETITVMIQREVALRICAEPGTKDYGAFTLFCQYHAHCEQLFDVPPDCFYPAPKVTSSVIRMTPYLNPPVQVEDEALLFRVLRASFAQRRKTLLNSLHAAFAQTHSKERIAAIIRSCGLSETVRGERLSLAQFAQLSEEFRL